MAMITIPSLSKIKKEYKNKRYKNQVELLYRTKMVDIEINNWERFYLMIMSFFVNGKELVSKKKIINIFLIFINDELIDELTLILEYGLLYDRIIYKINDTYVELVSYAVSYGHIKCLKKLSSKINIYIDYLLFIAASKNKLDIYKYINKGISGDIVIYNALFEAVTYDAYLIVEYILHNYKIDMCICGDDILTYALYHKSMLSADIIMMENI